VKIHIGHSTWQDIITPDPAMTFDPNTSKWIYQYAIPSDATSVDVVFNNGLGTWDNNSGQDWHVPVSGGQPQVNFVMDGQLDASARLVGSANGVNLYAAWNNEQLYVACNTTANADLFILISDGSSTMVSSPWAKAGQVSQWQACLARESTNGWSGWFDGPTQQACGTVLEGVLDWALEFGTMPDSVFIAMGAYSTQDSGTLQFQIPSGNGDGNIAVSEYFKLILHGDLNFDSKVDMRDFSLFAGFWQQDCATWDSCGGADFDMSGRVDMTDLFTFLSHWLQDAQ
jgi:hypothetical protein